MSSTAPPAPSAAFHRPVHVPTTSASVTTLEGEGWGAWAQAATSPASPITSIRRVTALTLPTILGSGSAPALTWLPGVDAVEGRPFWRESYTPHACNRVDAPAFRAQCAQQKMRPSSCSTPCPMIRHPQCSHTGARRWIAHSKQSTVCRRPRASIVIVRSYSLPHISHRAIGSLLDIDERQPRLWIEAPPQGVRRLDQDDLEGRSHPRFQEMASVRRPVALADHRMRVEAWRAALDGDVSHEGQHLDLLVDRDPDVVLAGPVEIPEGHVLKGADGREVTRGKLLALGEAQQLLDRLITCLADQNERPLGPGTQDLRLHAAPWYPPASPA